MKVYYVNRYRLRGDGACEVATVYSSASRFDAGDMAERLMADRRKDGVTYGEIYKVEIFRV